MKLSPTEIFKGKKIFFIGGTGFVVLFEYGGYLSTPSISMELV